MTDAWVFIDDHFIGIFEAPFKIPVLMSGWKTIKLYPTILDNGISATKKIYPFLEPYQIDAELVQNEILTINPVTKYKDGVQFTILDFEDLNTGFQDSPSSLANLTSVNDPQIIQWFNGNKFGRVDLTQTNSNWVSATSLSQDLPRGVEIYLEVDYHNTASIVTGVVAINSVEIKDNINVQINKQDPSEVTWKKIYISLKTIVSGSPSAEYFEHSFQSLLEEGMTSAQINIDNIKVVHF